MAINKIDSTGTIIRVSDDGGSSYEVLGCVQSVGSLEETRSVTSYSCLGSNDSTKSLGAIERGTLDISVLLDVETSGAAQEIVRTQFAANKPIKIQIELSNKPSGGTSGTIYEFDAQVSKSAVVVQKDEAVMYDFAVEIISIISETDPA